MKDCIAGRGDERDRQQVRLAEPQQQARHRQHGDRQHQGAAERLQRADGG